MADQRIDINYELYKVFYYVATTLSFSEASKKLYITQSAVSQSIRTLEKKLDRPLFIRTTKKVQLSPAGQVLLQHIEPAMNLILRGEQQILDAGKFGMDQLRIGASDTICRYVLVPYLKQFHELFPDTPIRVTNATSIRCVELLEDQQVDVIFTNFPNNHLNSSYVVRQIRSFQDVFVASSDHFQLKGKKLSLSELTRLPLMTLDRHSTTSEFLQQLFRSNQLELVPEVELSSNDLLIDLARIGLGIACVPDYCVDLADEKFYCLSLDEALPRRQIAAAVSPAQPGNRATEEFLKLFA